MLAGRAWFWRPFLATLAVVGLLLSACTATPSTSAGTPTAAAEPRLAQAAASTATAEPTATPPPTEVPATAAPPAPSPTLAPSETPTPEPDRASATGEIAPAGLPGSAQPDAEPPLPTATPAPAGSRLRVVCLDPGHGGPEVGAASGDMAEKNINLKIALKAAELLRAAGYHPVLTRDSDRAVDPRYTGNGYRGGLTYDVQRRVDICNAAQADLFFSIHNNGSADPELSGTEVWYNEQREFSDRNLALAKILQQSLLQRLRALGYPAVDRGIKVDTHFRIFQGRPYNLYVLGPGDGARPHVPTLMPGVLGESLFLSNPGDAAMLRRDSTLDTIAAGYRDAVVAYFERFPN